ncbi:hypothetical protein CYMTET_16178 [Cymbomonas tetramitiformis]|uniref:Uncharacterized protein n=1 Tax=Cymbomonas tetramitiformis TaxID=36881 RepID=A0AAE0GCW7_9CHLO|nr:hypothetical protein CYMTET_16178 [Cymbomonas tetramitiformis]
MQTQPYPRPLTRSSSISSLKTRLRVRSPAPKLSPKVLAGHIADYSIKFYEKSSHLNDANNVAPFKTAVRRIHHVTINAVREHAFKMFIETFVTKGEQCTCEWFEEAVWWGKWSGWTLGTMPPGTPSTQNAAEDKNGSIKNEITLRKLLQLSGFHKAMLKFLRDEPHYDDQHPLPTCGVKWELFKLIFPNGVAVNRLLLIAGNVVSLIAPVIFRASE